LSMIAVALSGCAQAREDAIVQTFKGTMEKLVDKAKLDQTSLAATGKITNPVYRINGFAGIGGYFDGAVSVNGVDITVSAMGSGSGEATPDPVLSERIFRIIANKELSAEQRRQMIYDALTGAGAATKDAIMKALQIIEDAVKAKQATPVTTIPAQPAKVEPAKPAAVEPAKPAVVEEVGPPAPANIPVTVASNYDAIVAQLLERMRDSSVPAEQRRAVAEVLIGLLPEAIRDKARATVNSIIDANTTQPTTNASK
jgi:hypothetical protein